MQQMVTGYKTYNTANPETKTLTREKKC